MSGSATLAEAMSHAGYDYLVLDLEHGPSSVQAATAPFEDHAELRPERSRRFVDHLLTLGASTIARADFVTRLDTLCEPATRFDSWPDAPVKVLELLAK